MYEIRVFDGGDKPLFYTHKKTEEVAIEMAEDLMKGEEATWRAEVWSPDGKRVHLATPKAK